MEYKFSEDFTEKDYKELLVEGYDYNQLGLDIIAFVLNIFLLIFSPFLAKISLILLIIAFILSLNGHDISLGKNYDLGNKLFDISNFCNYTVYILTIINLIIA